MAKAKPITGLDMHAPTRKNAALIARTRLEELYSWSEYVDKPYAVRELHNLRIAAKRLRYTLEIFEEALPRECKPMVKELEQLQEELGQLHDTDVMISLLRLCLGSQESSLNDKAFLEAQKEQGNRRPFLRPELVATLLNPAVAPSPEERYGLEHLLRKEEEAREQQYAAFRQHWYGLQQADFRRHLLDILDKEPAMSRSLLQTGGASAWAINTELL
jgi:hypothetical protein